MSFPVDGSGSKGQIPLPSQEELLRAFSYDPETGILRWNIDVYRHIKKGSVAGCGRRLQYKGIIYTTHRIIWKMVHGTEPLEIDHRDLNPFNNRIDNLRPASPTKNNLNKRAHVDNKLGVKGVHMAPRGKYRAIIVIPEENKRGKQKHLGYFDTIEEAKEAHFLAVKQYHGDFGRPE